MEYKRAFTLSTMRLFNRAHENLIESALKIADRVTVVVWSNVHRCYDADHNEKAAEIFGAFAPVGERIKPLTTYLEGSKNDTRCDIVVAECVLDFHDIELIDMAEALVCYKHFFFDPMNQEGFEILRTERKSLYTDGKTPPTYDHLDLHIVNELVDDNGFVKYSTTKLLRQKAAGETILTDRTFK